MLLDSPADRTLTRVVLKRLQMHAQNTISNYRTLTRVVLKPGKWIRYTAVKV